MKLSTSLAGFSAVSFAYFLSQATAQSYQTHNLTPDAIFHNEYHGYLAMASYADLNSTCAAYFTEPGLLKNFPDSTRAPWTLVSTFGPTPSGCSGYTAIVPEMNKQLIVFRGNYSILESLSPDQVPFSEFGVPECQGCMANAQAVQAYNECKNETNDFQAIRDTYYGAGMVFSIVGHGFGGMIAQIAGVDFYQQKIDYYNHALGAPLVFNQKGATWFNNRFNGEAGERATYGNDIIPLMFRDLPTYAVSGTQFFYGLPFNASAGGPSMTVCWTEDGELDDPACQPHDTGTGSPIQDHWYYSTNVGRCDSEQQDTTIADAWMYTNNSMDSLIPPASNVSVSSSAALSSSSAAPSATLLPATIQTPVLVASAYPSSIYVQLSNAKSAAVINAAFSPLSLFFAALVGAFVLLGSQ